jgi:hypothetical protein
LQHRVALDDGVEHIVPPRECVVDRLRVHDRVVVGGSLGVSVADAESSSNVDEILELDTL